MIELYSFPTPNGHKVSIALEELGLDYEIVPINIARGDQFSEEFLRISPNNRIPAIVDLDPAHGGDPLSIFESGAILVYLADKQGAFIGDSVRGRTVVMEWLMWQMGGFGPMLGQAHHFNAYAPMRPDGPVVLPYAQERYTNEAARLYGVLDRQLAEHEYVAADEYTIADMAIWPWYGGVLLNRVYDAAEFLDADSYTHVMRWTKEMDGRDTVQRGRMVNRVRGELHEQLHERHDASDFTTRTQDKIEAAR